jgi:erythromycin esterase
MLHALLSLLLLITLACTGCTTTAPLSPVERWIKSDSLPITNLNTNTQQAQDFRNSFNTARVVALGEATHGQHESFEAKRAITMHLIAHHGYRIVAYEASASKALACNAYISGASDDLDAAMKGFGMLIWKIEENAQLLRDLRAWNQQAPADQQVRFIGIDVQDADACSHHLASLLDKHSPTHAAAVRDLGSKIDDAIQQMMTGNRTAYDDLVREQMSLHERIHTELVNNPPAEPSAKQLRSALREFEGMVHRALTNGRRDRAMADMLLGELEDSAPTDKAVLWAHNGHIMKSPLRFMGTDELAAGGHLASSLGARYYAIGFAFGSGDFVANDLADGKWIYKTYTLDAAPAGSLESPFAAHIQTPSLIDLRNDTRNAEVESWKLSPQPQRWYGGYRIPANIRDSTRDLSNLMPTYPKEAFDALLFLPTTTASTPRK